MTARHTAHGNTVWPTGGGRSGRTARRMVLLATAGLMVASTCSARPPTPAAAGRVRTKPVVVAGDSHVPGFPATPAVITREYGDAFVQAEITTPDVERILHAFKHPDMVQAVMMFLPRYFSPRLVEPTRNLLRDSNPAHQAGAISGLISLLDTTPDTRAFIRNLLRSPSALVRGRAAEFLCWFGEPADYAWLTKAGGAERDRHARAAMLEAAAAIKHRAMVFGAGPCAVTGPAAAPSGPDRVAGRAAVYQQLAAALAPPAAAATRLEVIKRLRGVEICEPITRHADQLDHAERGAELLRIHRMVAGYAPEPAALSPVDDGPPGAPAAARTLCEPVRDYFDAKRKSYGLTIPDGGGAFVGKVHVGDDVAWRMDHEPVVAIGHGIVRSVDLGRKSWGGLVIIEHHAADGSRFCSLYGHLGPLVCVQPGQIVKQGQKLGAVGVSYSHANGGYLAHLHFGIHRGAFLIPDQVGATINLPDQPDTTATVTALGPTTAEVRLPDGSSRTIHRGDNWSRGYLTPAAFKSPDHGWVDPQEFIRRFR